MGAERASTLAPITATVQRFKELSGLGSTSIYELIKSGDIESVTIGRRRLIIMESWHQLVARRKAECSSSFAVDRHEPARRDESNDGSLASMPRNALINRHD